MSLEPLPKASVSQIIGLLEYLNDFRGYREDIYELAGMFNMDIDDLSPIIDAAEMLGFVEIIDGDIKLTQEGKKFVDADINDRKLIFKERLKKTRIFKEMLKILNLADEKSVDREELVERLEEDLHHEDAEESMNIIVDWGRFAELIGYSADSEEVYLDEE